MHQKANVTALAATLVLHAAFVLRLHTARGHSSIHRGFAFPALKAAGRTIGARRCSADAHVLANAAYDDDLQKNSRMP